MLFCFSYLDISDVLAVYIELSNRVEDLEKENATLKDEVKVWN